MAQSLRAALGGTPYRYTYSSGFMRQDQAYGLPLMMGDMRPTNIDHADRAVDSKKRYLAHK